MTMRRTTRVADSQIPCAPAFDRYPEKSLVPASCSADVRSGNVAMGAVEATDIIERRGRFFFLKRLRLGQKTTSP
jgi:hypothetical protein